MRKLAVLHFQPLELYPPAVNTLNYLNRTGKYSIIVFTTGTNDGMFKYVPENGRISVKRFGNLSVGNPAVRRYFNYFLFYVRTFFYLLRWAPKAILYYETLSAFPALAYKAIKKSTPIFVHYHEYTSLNEYQEGMIVNKLNHQWEIHYYKHYFWISHTNSDRLNMFLAQHPEVVKEKTFIIPNFPPKTWKKARGRNQGPVKVIYVGSLSLKTMYVKAFSEWVVAQNGKVIWDIYAFNLDSDVIGFISSMDPSIVRFKGGLAYEQLPQVICQYDVGVVLYNGAIPNYTFIAPNKLFEYLSGDIDVWFPNVLIGSLQYITTDSFPKILSLDFTRLDQYILEDLIDVRGKTYKPLDYYAEQVLPTLEEQIDLAISI